MLFENIFYRLLRESKLDTLANSVVRKIVLSIKNEMGNINDLPRTREGKFAIRYTALPEEVIADNADEEFKINSTIKIYGTSEDKPPSARASWDWKVRALEVHIIIMSMTGTVRLNDISGIQASLYEAIRHELEHSSNEHELVGSIKAYNKWAADPANIKKRKLYYTDPGEVAAFTSGIYNAAKRTRQPFKDVVEDRLEKIKKSMLKDPEADPKKVKKAIDDIRKTWIDYAKVRFPQAII